MSQEIYQEEVKNDWSPAKIVDPPLFGLERIAAVRKVVETKQYAKIDGSILDLFSASCIIAVYDKLSPTSQERYRQMNVRKMATIAYKLVK